MIGCDKVKLSSHQETRWEGKNEKKKGPAPFKQATEKRKSEEKEEKLPSFFDLATPLPRKCAEEEENPSALCAASSAFVLSSSIGSAESATALLCSAPVQELVDTMVGQMVRMHAEGISETTIFLNAPEYEGSLFYGTKIVIQEYSTAPKMFNVQLISHLQAVERLQVEAGSFLAAFKQGDHPFAIHRLDTSLLSESSIFREREEQEEKNEDEERR